MPKHHPLRRVALLAAALALACATGACDVGDTAEPEGAEPETSEPATDEPAAEPSTAEPDAEPDSGLHAAFSEFDVDNVTVVLSGDDVIIESNGLANHTSPYWSNTNERTINGPMGAHTTPAAAEDHPLFVEPTVTSFDQMAPGNIDDFNGSFELVVSAQPEQAATSSTTGLGPIGIAVSGAMIYNDEEGPNVPLDDAVGSLDDNGAHTGPQSYHYHLEPKAWSNDDDALIGVMADGFFLYGRRCASTGDHPDDLDASGGHTGLTQHADEPEYHYHIQNEAYLGAYYILFPGNLQGTPSAIQ